MLACESTRERTIIQEWNFVVNVAKYNYTSTSFYYTIKGNGLCRTTRQILFMPEQLQYNAVGKSGKQFKPGTNITLFSSAVVHVYPLQV